MEKKINVLFIIGRYFNDFSKEFGGTTREFYSIINAFKKSDEVDLEVCLDFDINKWEEYKKRYDVIHCEDNKIIKELLKKGLVPDVIGPTAKSPAKNEKAWNKWKKEGLNPLDYYKAIVVRNNQSEERINGLWENIEYIKLGVDTKELSFSNNTPKRWVLWAGDICRDAKNFKMFMEIMETTNLPNGYNWKVLSGYTLQHYIQTLHHTALLVNTSKNETFCFAMFEANSIGVPSIYPRGLHNPVGHKAQKEFHKNKRIQVEYNVPSFKKAIEELLSDDAKLEQERISTRKYVVKNASYQTLRESFTEVYKKVYISKNAKKPLSERFIKDTKPL